MGGCTSAAFIQPSILRPSRSANWLPDPAWQLEQLCHTLPCPPENTAALCTEHVLTTFSACPEVAPTARDRERKGDEEKTFFHNSFIIRCILSEPTAEEREKKSQQSPFLLNQYLHKLLRGSVLEIFKLHTLYHVSFKASCRRTLPRQGTSPAGSGAALLPPQHAPLAEANQTLMLFMDPIAELDRLPSHYSSTCKEVLLHGEEI